LAARPYIPTGEEVKPMGKIIKLPTVFPEGTWFGICDEEIPVAMTPDGRCTAWDAAGGRPFATTSMWYGRGARVDEAAFRDFVRNQPFASA
jgi:hypothetical protein